MTRLTYLSALALGAAVVGCNCGYQSWRRGPACATPAPSACAPTANYGAPYEETYIDSGAPTLRPGTVTPTPTPGQ